MRISKVKRDKREISRPYMISGSDSKNLTSNFVKEQNTPTPLHPKKTAGAEASIVGSK